MGAVSIPRVAWYDIGGPLGWSADPRTGLGPHHVTRRVVDVTILRTHEYWMYSQDGQTYTNADCKMDFTITPK